MDQQQNIDFVLRTVDVHIRRIRSKVGPQIAGHISTVRGVGYLFKE